MNKIRVSSQGFKVLSVAKYYKQLHTSKRRKEKTIAIDKVRKEEDE